MNQNFELQDRAGVKVILRFVHGSHLYGTATPASDIDIRGVFIPSVNNILGFGEPKTVNFSNNDTEFQPLPKFMKLAMESNPNIVEFLFVPLDYCPVDGESVYFTPEWEVIVNNRELFLSSKARWTFSGYAVAQLKRLKKHRNWLIYGENNKMPNREDYGLPPERKIVSSEQIGAFNVIVANRLQEIGQLHELRDTLLEMNDTVDYIGMVQGMAASEDVTTALKTLLPEMKVDFIDVVQREKRYANDKKEYGQYLNWKKNRNEKRFELEKKYGYDTKFAAHCVRLINEGRELLQTGNIIFPRPDAELLLDIRNGCWSYDELMDNIEDIDVVFDELYKTTTLPKTPDKDGVEEICIRMLRRFC